MDFGEWEPWYEEILDDFNYSRDKDRRAASLMAELRMTDSLSPLESLENRTVEVAGPFFDESKSSGITVAAGSAVEQVSDTGIEPKLIVTDLDGNKELQLSLNLKNVPAVIHSHGDNIQILKRWAERFEGPVISTCQCEPTFSGVHNFGGFTDGDRACFIAEHFGAEKILLNGWDFDKPFNEGDREKMKKLGWAKRLLDQIDTPIEHI